MIVTYRRAQGGASLTALWKYLWAKHVVGADLRQHCARCLRGSYLTQFGLAMPINEGVAVDLPDGELVYFCGVSRPYRWENNAHLAVVAKAGATARVTTYTGDVIEVEGAEALPINAEPAQELFGHLGRDFTTCRNFQFAAQYLNPDR